MRVTYIAAANNTTSTTTQDSVGTTGAPLGPSAQDVLVKKIFVGKPVGGGNITIYNKSAVMNGDTDNILFKYTFPSTLTSSYQYVYQTVFDFTFPNNINGLEADGGVVVCDQAMQVTVLWAPVDEEVAG